MFPRLSIYTKFFFIILALALYDNGNAQSKSMGNLIVENRGEIKLYGVHTFLPNNAIPNNGILGTERRNQRGFISFMPSSSWVGADDNAFVDGYVKSYLSTSFIFPIGDNRVYRPIKIEKASLTNPTDAAYFKSDPSVAITTPFFGLNNPVLPLGGPFDKNQRENTLIAVSAKEYWDINGTVATKITLSWDASSDVTTLASGLLNDLTIAGWNGTKWVKLESQIDPSSIFSTTSSLSKGSITTTNEIIPNTYSVYTLAAKLPDANEVFSSKTNQTMIWQNNSKSFSFPFLAAISDTNLTITILNSNPQFGKLSTVTKNGYTYTAGDTLGVDTIRSIASIYNKRVSKYYYDTFYHLIFVRYQLNNATIDMGVTPKVSLGKTYFSKQKLGFSYSYKAKKGVLSNYNKSAFDYVTTIKNSSDTLIYIFKVDYLGLAYTSDTTIYYIKTTSGSSSIYHSNDEEIFIQNILTPNGDGDNDVWVLPSDITMKHPQISVSISDLSGRVVYRSAPRYQNNWNGDYLPSGVYVYEISADKNLSLKGLLRIAK